MMRHSLFILGTMLLAFVQSEQDFIRGSQQRNVADVISNDQNVRMLMYPYPTKPPTTKPPTTPYPTYTGKGKGKGKGTKSKGKGKGECPKATDSSPQCDGKKCVCYCKEKKSKGKGKGGMMGMMGGGMMGGKRQTSPGFVDRSDYTR